MSSIISDLIIARPKRAEGSFVCDIKTPFKIDLSGSIFIGSKPTNDGCQIVFLSNKKMHNFFYDLNNRIIEIVKAHCTQWFNTSMSPDIIEDYYVNTIVYDKTYGDLIKLKIIGDDLVSPDLSNQTLNITLNACNIRFYKQKFVLETSIENYEIATERIEFSDEEDIAFPSVQELEEMKKEVLTMLQIRIDELESQLEKVQDSWKIMNDASDPDEIVRIYDSYK